MRALFFALLLGCAHVQTEPTPAIEPCLDQPTRTVSCNARTRVDGYACAICEGATKCATLALQYCAPSCADPLCIPTGAKK